MSVRDNFASEVSRCLSVPADFGLWLFRFCQLKDLFIELSSAGAKQGVMHQDAPDDDDTDDADDADDADDDGDASCFPPSPPLLANC